VVGTLTCVDFIFDSDSSFNYSIAYNAIDILEGEINMLVWKQINIPSKTNNSFFDGEIATMHRSMLLHTVVPIINELVERKLIEEFHYLFHKGIDLRLKLKEEDVVEVNKIIEKFGVMGELENWEGSSEVSRANLTALCVFSFLVLLDLEVSNDPVWKKENSLSLWMHYLCNSYGITNLAEAELSFTRSLSQLEIATYYTKAITPKNERGTLRWMKLCIDRHIISSYLSEIASKYKIEWPRRLYSALANARNSNRSKKLRRNRIKIESRRKNEPI